MNFSGMIAFVALGVVAYAIGPASLIWGWLRLSRQRSELHGLGWVSFGSFLISSAVFLFTIASIVAAHATVFDFYDPRLMRMFRWGTVLSLLALVVALAGVWKSSPLRWHALGSAVGALSFWIIAAELE